MKSINYLSLVIVVLLLSMKSDKDNRDLLCHKWIQFALKQHNAPSPQLIDKSMAKESLFKPDGTYEDAMYNNALKTSGQWFLNEDQSKLEFTITSMNGQNMPPFSETTKHYNIIILKLSRDTLVYGQEAYYGSDKIYGHDDLYFVKE
jgi:hypothetical protein